MNKAAGRAYAPPSKALPSTLCQKCLKRGHYSYECTSKAQERPYTTRPSRTQQLLNPKLKPKLASDEPNTLLRTKGIADEQLSRIDDERGRKRRRLEDGDASDRSTSSSSQASVSTISTNASPSPPPPKSKHASDTKHVRGRESGKDSKARSRHKHPPRHERHKRSRSAASSGFSSNGSRRERRPRSNQRDQSNTGSRRRRSISKSLARNHRLRSRSPSRGSSRSRSRDVERGHPRRTRRSSSPDTRDRAWKSADKAISANDVRSPKSERVGSGADRQPPQPPRQRSLSPYSKRLALTQSMNMGR